MLPPGPPSCAFQPCGDSAPLAAAAGRGLPGAGGFSEGAPSQVSASARTVQTERLEKEIALVRQPLLKEAMTQTLADLQQGKLPGFRLLQGARQPCVTACGTPGSVWHLAARRARAPCARTATARRRARGARCWLPSYSHRQGQGESCAR